jgi:hypothetical protein
MTLSVILIFIDMYRFGTNTNARLIEIEQAFKRVYRWVCITMLKRSLTS